MTNTSGCGGGEADPEADQNLGMGTVTIKKIMEHHVNARGEQIRDGQVWQYRSQIGEVAANGMVWAHTRTVDVDAQHMATGERTSLDGVEIGPDHNLLEAIGVRDALAHVLGRHLPEGWFSSARELAEAHA